jgi:hypothetical protein
MDEKEEKSYVEKIYYWYFFTLFSFIIIGGIAEIIAHFIFKIPHVEDTYAQVMIIGLTIISAIFEILLLSGKPKNG